MYFTYGWPKVLDLLEDDSQWIVDMKFAGGLLVVVTSTALQIWSAGQVVARRHGADNTALGLTFVGS